MEQLISDVETYAAQTGMTPQNVLRCAINAGGRDWQSWVDGRSSPRVSTVDRLRAWMRDNPPRANARAADSDADAA